MRSGGKIQSHAGASDAKLAAPAGPAITQLETQDVLGIDCFKRRRAIVVT